MFRTLLSELASDLVQLDERVSALDKLIENDVKNDPVATRLMQLRGIGCCALAHYRIPLAMVKSTPKAETMHLRLG